jgi:cardiolipin synthase
MRISNLIRLAVAPLLIFAFVTGCSHTVSRGMTYSALNAVPPKSTLHAYVHHDDLLLVFGDDPGRTIFRAHWKESVLESKGDYRFRTAEMKLVEKLPSSVEKLRPSVREATIVPADRTPAIVKHMVERLAPARTGESVRLAFFQTEFVIFRDAGGEPRFAPAARAPEGLKETARLNPTQFAAALLQAVQEAEQARGGTSRLFLVESAREGKPSTFFLLDLEQKLAVVTLAPNQADVASEKMSLHGGARTLEAALIEGQLLCAIKNPVSFAGRAINFGVQTLAVMLRPRSWPEPDIPPVAAEGPGPGMDLPAFEKWLDARMGSARTRGSIRLFVNGDEFFPLLDRRVDEAKESIHFRVCIWDVDDTGVDLADRVKRRSFDLKETDVVVDRITSLDAGFTPPATPLPEGFQPPRAIQPYLRDGSRVKVRNFLNGMTMGDHAKVYIVDRKYAYIGGMNVGREYRHEWHDVMVELEGPIVGWFERDFQLAWSHAGALGDLAYAAAYLTQGKDFVGPETREDYVEIRPIYTKTLNPVVLRSLVEALSRAKRYAWIENPYIYDDSIIRALIKARRRGVDVRVVMPTQSDMNSADSNNKVKANRLMAHGIRVYAYPGMLHTKVAVVDGWAIVGSCNFNKLSLRMNDESGIATTDPKFVATLNERLFESDFKSSRIVTEPLPVTSSDVFAEALAHQE